MHNDKGETVGSGTERKRDWIVQQLNNGKTFCCIHLSEDDNWRKGSTLTLNSKGGLSWNDNLPFILKKRKTFISYYHKDDQKMKESFQNLISDLIVNKSVDDDE